MDPASSFKVTLTPTHASSVTIYTKCDKAPSVLINVFRLMNGLKRSGENQEESTDKFEVR